MRHTLRTVPAPTSPKDTSHHRGPLFSVSNLRKISGIPVVQKLHVPDDQLLDLMVSIQVNLEKERQKERDRVIVYDPAYFSGLVELAEVDPLRHSMAMRTSWPFVGRRAHYSFEVMTVLSEGFEDEDSILVRQCEVTSRFPLLEGEEEEDRFTELISPKHFHTVDSMIDRHLDEYLDDGSKCILEPDSVTKSFQIRDSVTSRYERESTTLAKLDHAELLSTQHAKEQPATRNASGPLSVTLESCNTSDPDTAYSRTPKSLRGLSIDTKSTRTSESFSSDSVADLEIEAIVHLRSPWADEPDSDFVPQHFVDCAVAPSTIGFLGKAPSWDRLPRRPRSKSMQSQESSLNRYRTTRFPSAAL